MIKLLFINAINPESEIETRYTPLGILYLSASLKKALPAHRFEIKLINKDIEKHLNSFKPDLVGITSVSQNFNHSIRYASLVHGKGIPTMVGGVHISMIPECLTTDMDIGCLGEGELTIIELMKVFLEHKEFPAEALKTIDGIIFWKDGKQVKTPDRLAIKEMDQLIPHPDRSLEGPVTHGYVFSSRGCPYRCAFCASSRYWKQVRFFSPEYILEEVEYLVNKSGAKIISFYDDLFITNKKRVHNIANLMEQSGLAQKIKFTCSCRSNMVDKDIVADLKRMGVVSVGLGLESGNLRVLNYLKGKTVTVEDNQRAVDLLTSAGIKANASFIIGSPDETEAEIMETYDFIRKSKLSFVDTYVLTPYPGTPVWEIAKSRGLVSNNMNWKKLNVNFEVSHESAIILSETISKERLFQIYKKFRRQRLVQNIRALITHPMLLDLPKVALGIVQEKIARFSLANKKG